MSQVLRVRGTRRPRRGLGFWLLFLACCLLSTFAFPGIARAAGGPPYLGRPLVEVLNEFRDGGLALIFSSASVADELRVTVEPRAVEPLQILGEILEPLGLELGDGPGDSLLVLPRRPGLGAVRGSVLSEGADLPVRRASVSIADIRVRSGRKGAFDVKDVPPGSAELVVEAFGFEDAVVPVEVVAGETARLVVRLRAKPSFSETILVTPDRRFVLQGELPGQRSVDDQEAVLVPAIGGDIGRIIGTIPGVAASDNSAAFHVRGSALGDVAIVLDGLEIYDAFHLRNFQSPFSVVDGRIVDRIDFLGGGFTVDRGDRHGAFVDISTVEPEEDGRGVLALGTENTGVSYGGPLTESGATWLLSLRGWYPEAGGGEPIQLGGGERLDPRFADVYSKFSFAGSPRFLVTVHSLLAFDRIEYNGSSVEQPSVGESANVSTQNAYSWLRARGTPSPRTMTETVLSWGRIERRRDGTSTPGASPVLVVRDHRVFDLLGLKHDSTWEVSDSQTVRAGIDLRFLDSRYDYSRLSSEASASTSLRIDPAGTAVGVYVAHRARLSPRLATETGLRWDRQSFTVEDQFSPRINASWLLGDRSELLVALGEFHQSQRIHELRIEDGETEFLPAELSRQAELTFKHRFPGGLRLRIDGFYKQLSRLRPRYENLFEPIELFPETRLDRIQVAPTRARLRGAEIMLRGKDDPELTWWVSYARSASDDIVDGRPVPRTWDQTDSLRFLVGRRWGSRWTTSLSGIARTGWPTTAVRGAIPTSIGDARGTERILGPRNADRFGTYARLDGKVALAFPLASGRLALTLEVINLTDRRNACCVDDFALLPRPDGTVDVQRDLDYWPGLTPSANLTWEF